jgi:hypothetical protein
MKFASMALPLVLLFTFPSAGPVAGQEVKLRDVFTWEVVPCPAPLPVSGEIEGRTYDCGVVTVPENYDAPNGRTIELAYMRLRSSSPTPTADPLVYLAGGPGGSSIHEFTALRGICNATRPRREVGPPGPRWFPRHESAHTDPALARRRGEQVFWRIMLPPTIPENPQAWRP